MAQTTSSIWGGAAYVEISTNGSAWTDISGMSNKVENTNQARRSGESYTFDGDTAIIKAGKREPMEITVQIVYTEGASDAWETVQTQHETAGGGALYLRWAPAGNSAGKYQFTSAAGIVTDFYYPSVDPETDGPLLSTFTIKVPEITQSTVST